MSKEVFLWFALSEQPLMLGKHTGNSWTTLWISCHNNLIYLSLVSFDPFESCVTSVWICDFQAYSMQTACLFDCIPQITWSVDYIRLGVWILQLQNTETSQVIGTQDLMELSLNGANCI